MGFGSYHRPRTPREEIAFTEWPKIHSHSQIFRYGRSIFCLPYRPTFSDIIDLCLHWVSVVRGTRDWGESLGQQLCHQISKNYNKKIVCYIEENICKQIEIPYLIIYLGISTNITGKSDCPHVPPGSNGPVFMRAQSGKTQFKRCTNVLLPPFSLHRRETCNSRNWILADGLPVLVSSV